MAQFRVRAQGARRLPGVFRRAHGAQLSTEPGKSRLRCTTLCFFAVSKQETLTQSHTIHTIQTHCLVILRTASLCAMCTVLYGVRIAGPFPALCFPSPPPWMRRQPYPDAIVLLHCIPYVVPYVMDGAAMTDKALAPRWLPRTSRGG